MRVWPLAGLVVVPVALAASRDQDPVFTARVDTVRVDTLVTDGGRPVRGLGPADFEVRDNGVLQRIDLFSFEEMPLNVVLVLDMSRSMRADRLVHLRTAGRALLDGLQQSDQAALVTFSEVVAQSAALTTDLARVRNAIDAAEAGGGTALVDGCYAGLIVAEADLGRSLVIVFSDGLDTASWLSPMPVLDVAKRSDVVVYAVTGRGIGRPAFLRDLTTLAGGRLLETESTTNLAKTFLTVLEEFRRRYLLAYTPRGVVKAGWHQLDVRVKRPNVTVKARPGYQVALPSFRLTW